MKYLIFSLFLLGILSGCNTSKSIEKTNETTTVYLVRHAEKQSDGTRDPDLTQIGQTRARRLAYMLTKADIDKVYSTDYKRTRNTAKPVAKSINKEVEMYNPQAIDNLVAEIKSGNGMNYLIVGHSNSTPTLVNLILGEEKYQQLDESDYGNLFILQINGDQIKSSLLQY